jgi:ABC-type uncharacterized transport system permease subunit
MKTAKELRKFGLVVGAAFALLAVFLYFSHRDLWKVSAALSTFLIVTGVLYPTLLRPLEWLWMRLALVLGFVVTNVLLTAVFLIAVIPTGLVMLILGKDPLNLRQKGERESYWRDVEPDGPCSRPDKPY